MLANKGPKAGQLKVSYPLAPTREDFLAIARAELADGADGISFDEDIFVFWFLRSVRQLTGRPL